MANWASLAPTWRPSETDAYGDALRNAAGVRQTQAQTQGIQQTTEAQRIANAKATGLQSAFASAITTTIDPKTGAVSHGLDNDKLLANLQGNPAALDAYKEYVTTTYPQAGKEAVSQRIAATANPETGAVRPSAVSAGAANSPQAAALYGAGQDMLKGQFGTAQQVAGAKAGLGLVGASQTDVSPTTVEGMEVSMPGASGKGIPQTTAEYIAKLPKKDRAYLVSGLISSGIESDYNTPQGIAEGMNKAGALAAQQSMKGFDPSNPSTWFGAVTGAAPAAQAAKGALFQTGLGTAGAIQGQTQLATTFDQAQASIQDAHRQGYTKVGAGNIGEFTQAKSEFDWLQNTFDKASEMKDGLKTGKVGADEFNAEVSALLNAPMVAESISTESGRSKFMENLRTDPSWEAIIRQSDGNILGALRGGAAAKLSAQSQGKVLDILTTIVGTQLKSGQAKSKLDQYKPKKWSEERPNAATGKFPEATKPPEGGWKPGDKARLANGKIGTRSANGKGWVVE